MRNIRALVFIGILCVALLVGCTTVPRDVSDDAGPSSAVVSTTVTPQPSVSDTTKETEELSNTVATGTAFTTQKTDKTEITTTTTSSIKPVTTTEKVTTTQTTTTTTATTTTAQDPNRAFVNGKSYAVGDTLHYTVMVKTKENYGTVKVGVRCVQKGLEVPEGTFQKQNQAVMKNIGIGRLGTMPEETIGKNGFTMTANKGYIIDTSVSGYAGLFWHYETTNYDYTTQSYRQIDCTNGVALFTIALKITKPGDYLVGCMEYANQSRADLTVWGVLS